MAEAKKDGNYVSTLIAVSSVDGVTPVTLYADPTTHRLLTDAAASLTNPMTTGGDLIYGGVAGTPTRLANGTAGQVLTSQGTTLAPIWSSAGGGDVTKVGTPVNNQVGVWTGDGTLEGDTDLTFDTATNTLTTVNVNATTFTGALTGTASGNLVAGGALGTPSSGTVTNLTGTASININGTVGATTPTTGVFTTLVANATTSLLLGTAGSAVGNIGFRNATSGTITLAPVAGALGTVTLTLPASTDTVAVLAASQAFTNKTYNGLTLTSTTGTFTLAAGKTLTVNNTITFSGTDSTTMTLPTSSKTLAANDGSNMTLASQATGDLITAASATTLGRLADVAVGQVLISGGVGVAPSYSANPAVTTLELGAGSTDTTLSRSAAGVLAVEGIAVPTISSTNTLTNKRITKRTGTTTSSATPTINTDNVDEYYITAQTVDITSFTTNLSGTPTLGQTLFISVIGTAARAITWGATFGNGPVALPTTTVTTTELSVLFKWDGSIWRCYASGSRV